MSGLLIAGEVAAAETTILECGVTGFTIPTPPFIGEDPGINIVRASSSEAAPPVDISPRASCTKALAGLLDAGYKLTAEFAIAPSNEVFVLVKGVATKSNE